jgi:hypothetical protein
VRCVSDEPWVTAAETCELAMALDAVGQAGQARELVAQIQFLRASDGSYWTGWQFENGKHFPHEQSSYTAAAVVLAADVLAEDGARTGGADIFRDAAAPASIWQAPDPAVCGCPHG